MRSSYAWLVAVSLLILLPASASTQGSSQAANSASPQMLPPEQLDALLAPIALYDDQLLAQVLMASTYPLEVVEADRWVKQNSSLKGDQLKSAASQKTWDDSLKALTAVPPVLDTMSTKLDWTRKLGDAVLAQQADVMDAVQRMRAKAQAQGKLTSTKQQKVSTRQEQSRNVIAIEPGETDTVYVPYYDPKVVYGDWPYASDPPYYWPPPGYIAGAAIATGIAWGAAWAVGRAIWNGGCNWGGNNIVVNRNSNINIGNRIGNNGNFANWQHNPDHRKGVRYNNDAVRQKFSKANIGDTNQRLDFRGRDGQQVLRPGENRPNAGDRRPGGERANAGNRPAGNRPGTDRPNAGHREAGNRGQSNRPSRDTGFSNIQPRAATNATANRGRASLANRGGGNSFAAAPRGGGHVAARGGGGGMRGGGGRRSDIALKHNIVRIGQLADGIGYYRFSYIGSERAYVGVMAQEVQAIIPTAVMRDRDGTLRVFYEKLGVKFQTYKQWIASGARVPTLTPVSQ